MKNEYNSVIAGMDSLMTIPHTCDRAEFVSPDDKYECPVCGRVLHNALQTACGHRLCEPCLDALLARADPAHCPGAEQACVPLSRTNNTVGHIAVCIVVICLR